MTHEDPDPHADLQRLFDRTASDASGPTLTKLGARAADVPRLTRKARLLPRWAWAPLFACAACALFVLARNGAHHTQKVEVASNAQASAPAATVAVPATSNAAPDVSMAVASASSAELGGAAPHTNASDDGDSLELLGDADEGARFEVSGPQSDRDLDAWLAATKELSGGT